LEWGWREASSTATEYGGLRIAQQSEPYAYSVMAYFLLRVKIDLLRLENGGMVQQKPDLLQDFLEINCKNTQKQSNLNIIAHHLT
jgi:hypothetical protein